MLGAGGCDVGADVPTTDEGAKTVPLRLQWYRRTARAELADRTAGRDDRARRAQPLRAQEQTFFAQMTDFDAVLEPPLPVAVSVTVKFPFGGKLCAVVGPLPVPPSPKFHAYDDALVVALASKLQLRPVHA